MQTLNGIEDTYVAGLGYRVNATNNLATDNDALFDVRGKVMITLLTGEVTTLLATTTTLLLRIKTSNVPLCAATTITDDADGTMYVLTGDVGSVLNGAEVPVIGVASSNSLGPFPVIVGTAGETCVIETDLNGAGTGVIAWTLFYIPLEAGAAVTASA